MTVHASEPENAKVNGGSVHLCVLSIFLRRLSTLLMARINLLKETNAWQSRWRGSDGITDNLHRGRNVVGAHTHPSSLWSK